jgi:hypothetical protein
MAKTLKAIDEQTLGDHLEDYCNPDLNKRLEKFLVLDNPSSIENILDANGFTDVTGDDVAVGITVAEATLVQVNRALKAQGIEWEFKTFDMVEYTAYMLVNTNDKVKATANRVRNFRLKQERVVDAATV